MGSGDDPHLYQASEGEISRMAEADVIFYNGHHLEEKMTELFAQMETRGIPLVAVAEKLDKSRLIPITNFQEKFDPHVWMDVNLWMEVVVVISKTFSKLDPAHATHYRRYAYNYLEELRGLNNYIKAQSAKVPKDQRVLVTMHNAFNYFGRTYGFEVMALQGSPTTPESGSIDEGALAQFMKENKITTLFVEPTMPPNILEGIKAQGIHMHFTDPLFFDSMGNKDMPHGRYKGMMRYNINAIVNAHLKEKAGQ
jgi:manganese/zinc/iron transport system substrate-binding protein